jgi:predicted enzyme related to lactoylglutathione lyase
MRPTIAHGKICYLQIPCADPKDSAAFYSRVFGWDIRTRGDGAIAFDDGVGEVSGAFVTGRTPQTNAGMLVYVMVDSVDGTLGEVVAAGGTVVTPIGADAPEVTARFADPFGNVFGLYQEPSEVA